MSKEYGVISVTGPRQSGKTTLVQHLFPKHKYINFENLAELDKVKEDPIGFLKSIEKGVIIDEVQKYPEILSYIQVSIDENYNSGKFILIGSQNLLLSNKVSQSLAGRVAIIKLYPLTISELKKESLLPEKYTQLLLKGFYPSIYDQNRTANTYYANYLNTYVERDVRTIQNIGNLSNFNKFLQILASRIGQILNLSEIGGQIGVSYKTIDSWLSILEASYIIFKLEPYYRNFGKRIIKSPKIYFTDVGLATHLLKLDSEKELGNYHNIGLLFENLVILEFYKRKWNTLSSTNLYFFKSKYEVDLILDKGINLELIEIKSSETFHKNYLQSIDYLKNILEKDNPSAIVYAGETSNSIRGTKILNYQDTEKISFNQ